VEILKQGQYAPVAVEKQVAIIYLGSKGLLNKVPVEKVRAFEVEFLDYMEAKHKDVLDLLKAGKLTDEVTGTLESVAADLTGKY
jgi:F-type H+-transporting ATPase subunit alpha